MELKFCLYARKSTEQDERQAMSISSQIKEMSDLANRDRLQIIDIKQESFSAKASATRPIFNLMIQELREGKYDAILTWAPDRLARNAGDLGSLVDLMDEGKLQQIRTFGQTFGNNPNEKFLLMILGSQAKLENDNRSINVKRGLRAKCETGWRPGMPPLGYFTRGASGNGRDIIIDEERAPYVKQMFEMSSEGKSGRHIRRWLEECGVRTRGHKLIPLSMIYKILKNPYYYGEFEYPTGSGNWYRGNHEPLVTKAVYDKVQEQLIVPQKGKWGAKDFPYKQFLKCYSCGSSIVGEEKTRLNRNGTIKKFVYYHCSRQVILSCKEPYATEDVIESEILRLLANITINHNELEPSLANALEKYALIKDLPSKLPATFMDYARFVILHGSHHEKIRLTRNLPKNICLKNRMFYINASVR